MFPAGPTELGLHCMRQDLREPGLSCLGRKEIRLLQGRSGREWQGDLGRRDRACIRREWCSVGRGRVEKEVTQMPSQLGGR